MKYRRLKKANLNLSEIGFGCMSLGTSHRENDELIRMAHEGGINYFDTADIYQDGFNEETVGRAIRPFRKQIILATKVGNEPNPSGPGWRWNPSKSYILKAVDRSLERLGTDYIDVYQLHGGTIDDNREEVIEAFETLKDQGKILHYGISSIRPNVIREYALNSNIVSNMLQYSLIDRRPEEELMHLLHEKGIGVIVRGALAKGLLAQKDLSNYLGYEIQSIELLRDKMNSFSIEKITNSQLSIKWVLANAAVTSIALGIRSKAQLQDALGVYQTPELSGEQVKELSSVLRPNVYQEHR